MANGIRTDAPPLPVVSIKDVVRSFDKHLKKAGGHIGWNVVEITITIKMKTIVRKTLMIKTFFLFIINQIIDNAQQFGHFIQVYACVCVCVCVYIHFYIYIYIYIYIYRYIIWLIGLVGRVFANSPEDLGLIPGRIIPKT